MEPQEHPTYQCSYCQLTFDEQHWQEACEAWCAAHQSCNLAITAHSREVQAAQARRDTGKGA
ncbi:MAG TPA: hypothetical protein VFY89_03135 [Ktedonobacterales bacterium]